MGTEVRGHDATPPTRAEIGMMLEVVAIPVSDVDRAKTYYAGLGWRLDGDFSKDYHRLIQFTPPGSQCSIQFGTKVTSAAPGTAQNLFLVVSDLEAARDELVKRGVEVSDVFHFAGLDRFDSDARLSEPAQGRLSYRSFVSFKDPDGNSWLVQEVTQRLPGRIDPEATSFGSASELSGALRRAEAAHGEHERRTGQRDANWPDSYAAYITAERTGAALPT
jgi:catechol 2,3-dioxygenase-like lactoylglutathione lyase family enzyme